MSYYIGLDNGGTSTKAAIFDRNGKQIGSASVSTASITPAPGFVERDMDEMWEANCTVLKNVLKKTGIAADEIAGVGICGHGKGLYLWGKDDRPDGHGIISTDTRAWQYVEQWKKDGTEAAAFEYSCQHVMACQPVALLAWIRDNEPQIYKNIKYVFECKDYVRFCLTGKAAAERTDYSGTGLMNLHTESFDEKLLELFGISEVKDALPPLCSSLEIAGYVSEKAAAECGLKAGTPVVGGMFDIDACALASGITDPDRICMIAGTWAINEYIRKSPITDGKVQMNSLYCLPGYYLIEESSATSAGCNEWFLQQHMAELEKEAAQKGTNIYEIEDEWVESVSPETFVPVFLPFLMASNVHPNARGSFVGMNVSHDVRHLARSVFEGITFGHRMQLERLLATRDEAPMAIRLAGGAAHAPVWAQMFADICQIPVEIVAAKETGALGCALAAASAVGEYGSLAEAAESMSGVAMRMEPDPSKKAIYDRKYEIYKKTVECLDGLWDDMQTLVQ